MTAPFTPFDEAWRRFLESPSVRLDDLEREGRAGGRAQLLVFLARVSDERAVERLTKVRDALAEIPGVDPFPQEYWHVTVKLCGFQVIRRTREDDVLRDEIPLLLGRAAGALRREEAFEAELGRVNAFPSAVFVEVDDGGRFGRLNRGLSEALPSLHRYDINGDGYLPHVTVARFTHEEGLDELKGRLAELRGESGGPLSVRRLDFVRVWLTEEYPDFDTVRSFPLVTGS